MQEKDKFYHADSFAPIVTKSSQILILGTMPGITSLEKHEYYGHPRNLFWTFLFEIFNEPFSTDFPVRVEFIKKKHLALWDTLIYCEREGSLDSNIEREQPNNIEELTRKFSNIHTIICNGKSAERYFKKYNKEIALPMIGMPSTSPANASISKETKFEQWKKLRSLIK